MTEAAVPQSATPRRRKRLALVLGLVGALVLGAAGFYLAWTGLIAGPRPGADEATAPPRVAFVPLDPLVISLGKAEGGHHLRFTAQLEVAPDRAEEVTALKPRILDVLNGYLRVLETQQLEDPSALVVLRAQMLRRVQIVTGEGQVRDLLVTEFVLN